MSTSRAMPASIPRVVLEPAAQTLADALTAAGFPPLSTLSPRDARAVLERVQAGDVVMPPAEVEPHTIPGGPDGEISIIVVRPEDSNGSLPAVVYTHGGGWILGGFATHERLVRDLAAQSGAALVFVNYTLAPEARYPVAVEQVFATVQWVARYGAELGLDGSRLAVAGDGAGGNMTAAATLLVQERGGPAIRYQALLYPVTDAGLDSESSRAFADGPWLTRQTVAWFWDAYAPDIAERSQPTASPLRASLAQLAGLPPALVITAEADLLRDEGEDYGRKLRAAGVDVTAVRYEGVFGDFMLLNALAETNASRHATALTAQTLKAALLAQP
jgi:acetyl esterase